jgi:isopentenyl-diphosphate delta-isomerase
VPSAHETRKADHLDLCATDDVAFQGKTTLFDAVELVHDALPELRVGAIDLSTQVAGRALRAPVVIAAMTGGLQRAERINRDLATVAQEKGLAFGFGSMRPLLEEGVTTGYLVRDVAPDAVVFGNVGVVQAARATTQQLVDLVGVAGVTALCVHLNPAQEVVQPGGDDDFTGGVDTIARLVAELPVPVIVKETGCGLSRRVGQRLRAVGVQHVDVGGAGGTSWVGVEALRARAKRTLGERYWDWGVPTAASVVQVADLGFETVIATGGVRHGLDVAKAVALGASAGGLARPFLQAHDRGGVDAVRAVVDDLIDEVRVACLLTGSRDLAALATRELVVADALLRWAPADHPVRSRLPSAASPG